MLDSDRVRLIARLKVAFDKGDGDGDGLLHQFEVREVVEGGLGMDVGNGSGSGSGKGNTDTNTNTDTEGKGQLGKGQLGKVKSWIQGVPGPGKGDKSSKGGLSFTEFVVGYCEVFAGADPMVRMGECSEGGGRTAGGGKGEGRGCREGQDSHASPEGDSGGLQLSAARLDSYIL